MVTGLSIQALDTPRSPIHSEHLVAHVWWFVADVVDSLSNPESLINSKVDSDETTMSLAF